MVVRPQSGATEPASPEDRSNAKNLALLLAALLFTGLSGFLATVALGITPDDFGPRFTGGSPALVGNEGPPPFGDRIPVTVDADEDVPDDWWCFSALPKSTGRSLPPGQMVCSVPRYATDSSSTEAQSSSNDASTDVAPAQQDHESGPNWAGIMAGITGLIGVTLAGLTQHEKFPWSAASRLARANARTGLRDIDGDSGRS